MRRKLLFAAPLLAVVVLIIIIIKEVKIMDIIYASLIIKGKKTINDVPALIRDKVRQVLIDLELPELAQ